MIISYFAGNTPGLFLLNQLTTGFTINEIPMPIVPACGEGIPKMYKTRQAPKPKTDEYNAPYLLAFFQNNPQINGPKKAEPMAPQDIPRIATIVSGLERAIIMDIKINIADVHRI